MPTVRMREHLHELPVRNLAGQRTLRLLESRGNDPIDATSRSTARQVKVLFDQRWQAQRMLDHFTIHIDDVQGTIRSVGKLYWSKPIIGRSQELTPDIDASGNFGESVVSDSL